MIEEVPACVEKLEAKLQSYKEMQHESSQKVRAQSYPSAVAQGRACRSYQ